MRYQSIKSHLRPYSIRGRRTTTINHAFAAAVAPHDVYDDAQVRAAVSELGQDPDTDLFCVYCDRLAETWDHVFSTVRNSRFSGYGHRLGNLLPCCKSCNSKKGNKSWDVYVQENNRNQEFCQIRKSRIAKYLKLFSVVDVTPLGSPLHEKLDLIRQQILGLCDEADRLANQIRVDEAAPSYDQPTQILVQQH